MTLHSYHESEHTGAVAQDVTVLSQRKLQVQTSTLVTYTISLSSAVGLSTVRLNTQPLDRPERTLFFD